MAIYTAVAVVMSSWSWTEDVAGRITEGDIKKEESLSLEWRRGRRRRSFGWLIVQLVRGGGSECGRLRCNFHAPLCEHYVQSSP